MAKVSELAGVALAYWVGRADGADIGPEWNQGPDYVMIGGHSGRPMQRYAPHEDWAQGGPLIQKHAIAFAGEPGGSQGNGQWLAYFSDGPDAWEGRGDTHLVAAMRAIVAIAYGDSVPDEDPA